MLVLASRSPRRRAILEQLGIPFRVAEPDVEELEEGEPRALVLENARRKARAVDGAEVDPEGGVRPLVLGVDTAVVLGSRVFGKPRDRAEAERFLVELSGGDHYVLSGLVLRSGEDEREGVAETRVRFRQLDESLLEWYLATEEWGDAAGGYRIQGRGAALVEAIEGDYLNVVGLPVSLLLFLAPELLG